MGMDVYGLNPKRNTVKPEILTEYIIKSGDMKGWTDWKRLGENNTTDEDGNRIYSKEWIEYSDAEDAWEEDNPGIYFRSDVWSWRPLWDYVCTICHDILDEVDQDNGHGNSGHQIDEKKAIAIAGRIDLFIKNGDAHNFSIERLETLEDMPDEECSHCEGTGKRDDKYVKGQCNACQGKGSVRPFDTNYLFDLENLEWFGKFCEQSGGFEIC